jgi:hypothetical protein
MVALLCIGLQKLMCVLCTCHLARRVSLMAVINLIKVINLHLT